MLLILHVSIEVKIFFNIQAANRRFANFKMCAEQPVEFEEDEITLGISKHGAQLAGGWTVLPYTHPGVSFTTTCITNYQIMNCVNLQQIHRNKINTFAHGQQLPSCHLHVKWNSEVEYQTELRYTVQLNGAKEPNHWMRLPIIQPPEG